nr:uncharacterized protein LOC123773316 [Procambarus clarkii]
MSLELLKKWPTPYYGKETFIIYCENNLEFSSNKDDMILKSDLFTSYVFYCKGNKLEPTASTTNIGKHMKGIQIRTQRLGTTNKQKYCYCGLAFKEGSGYTTFKPGKRGRKRTKEVVEITSEMHNEKYFKWLRTLKRKVWRILMEECGYNTDESRSSDEFSEETSKLGAELDTLVREFPQEEEQDVKKNTNYMRQVSPVLYHSMPSLE